MAQDKSGWVLGTVLARQAQRRGDQPFAQFQQQPALTYGQAHAVADRMARGLVAAGVQPGERVGVMLPNGLEILHAWFGLSRVGAVTVFINTAYKGAFLEHVLNNAQARLLIAAGEFLPELAQSETRLPHLREVYVVGALPAGHAWGVPEGGPLRRLVLRPFAELAQEGAPPRVSVSYRDVGAIMYTSGTTGPSKGVLMPHAHMYLFSRGEVEALRLTAEDVYYICMPLFHANALFMQLYATLIAGARCVIVPAFSASRWLDDVRQSGATVTNTLGVMTEFLFRQPPRPEDRQHRLRAMCAIPAPPEIAPAFQERFGVRLLEGYGMTEVSIPAHMRLDTPPRPGSAGPVAAEYFQVRIVDPDSDEELPAGAVGEIVVRPREPYAFMAGYNSMPDKTVEAWRNFWFHTGDAGRLDAEGYLYFVDRLKDTIRRRGENVSSFEVERVVAEHPAVEEVAAVAVKSPLPGGEDEIKVCIVLKAGAALPAAELLDFCQARMPYFAVPRYVEVLAALPKTPTQKVQKARLREAALTPGTWDRQAAGYRLRR